MNAHDMLPHEVAAELLPWLVNDSLDEDEKAAVLAHARACVICRREMSELERLRDSIAETANTTLTPEPDMRNINARIDAFISRQNPGRRMSIWIRDLLEHHWRIALFAQSILLLVLAGAILWPDQDNLEFTTLTETSDLPDGQYLRLVFSPELSQAELSGLLDNFELQVIDGPSNRGVYTLGLTVSASPGDRDELLAALQQDPRVLFAQPVMQERAR